MAENKTTTKNYNTAHVEAIPSSLVIYTVLEDLFPSISIPKLGKIKPIVITQFIFKISLLFSN